jgi:proteasome lid subunit RPN8/RPN11
MGNSDFEIIERDFGVPFRARTLHAGYVIFQAEGLNVYVSPEVASAMRERAQAASPRETGGLLAGRILRDGRGHYVVVTGMVSGPSAAGDFGSFNLSPDETAQLRRTLAEHYPSADVIGWWHSHSVPSRYSPTDRSNQAIWTDPHHIGLLVFAQGRPWASLYVGPQCLGPFPATGPPPDGTRADGAKSPHVPAESSFDTGHRPEGPFDAGSRRLHRVGVMALAALAILLVGFIGGRALSSGPGAVKHQIALSCVVKSVDAASCHTNSKGTVTWAANGTIKHGASAVLPLSGSGPQVVRVTVEDGAGKYVFKQTLQSFASGGVGSWILYFSYS